MNPQNRKKEIALLGGAFDPVTRGHIQIAEYVLTQCEVFDEVWLMPCYSHIFSKHMAGSEHRLKMCELTTCKHIKIKTFDYEIKNRIARETYYVMQLLLKENFSGLYNYSLIIGQDNANNFHHWIQYEQLQKLVRFVVVPRKGITTDKNINWYLKSPHINLTSDFSFDNSPIMEVSSTLVRNLINQKQFSRAKEFVDIDVYDYILIHNLYQNTQ